MELFFHSFKYNILALAISLVAIAVAYFKWIYTYWDRKGLKNTLKPTIPFGNMKRLLTNKISIGEEMKDIYFQLKKESPEHGGFYFLTSPVYMPLSPELIKNILQKDFQHFVNHGAYVNEEDDPLSGHLFALEDDKWRNLRIKLTPTFTSGKMKMMFHVLVDCTNGLKDILEDFSQKHEPMEIKDVFARFTTDIIGSAAFGLECNSLKDPNTRFRVEGRRIFEMNFWQLFKNLLQFALPIKFLKFIHLKLTKPETEEFFMDIVRKTIEYREKNNIQRNDFVHLLLQLKNRGKLSDDGKILDQDSDGAPGMTFNEFAAQCFVFFIAGFETSSTTSTFALFELARNPHIQEKLRAEINTVLEKHGGKITYDAIMEMTYLEYVLNESLRKYPPVPFLTRQCNKEYKIPNSDLVIENGTSVMICTSGLHNDPEYFPDPEKFDPDRFTEENKATRPAFTWLPFGEGPRLCIGLRFGMMQSKVGLVAILKNYKLSLSKRTKNPIQFDKNAFISTAEGGVWLDVEKI